MGRQKGFSINIPKLYKMTALDLIAFGYVQGKKEERNITAKLILPTIETEDIPQVSVSDGLRQFLDNFDLCEDTYCFDNAKAAYYRTLQYLVDIRDGIVDDINEVIITKT